MTQAHALEIRKLRVRYGAHEQNAVHDLSFDIAKGESVALVGESGCGKSTTAHAIARLLGKNTAIEGTVRLNGVELLDFPERQMEDVRGARIGMIFQEPMTSLNPVHRVGTQIAEAIKRHQGLSSAQARQRVLELLDLVKLPDRVRIANSYPHQLSGGQRQRAMIAMAVSCSPELLIADEPTTALDATVQAQILDLLDGLRRDLSMSLLLISHDLPLVARWTDRVIVMHHGVKIEELTSAELFSRARTAYTRGLQESSLKLDNALHYRKTTLTEIRSQRDEFGNYQFIRLEPQSRQEDFPSREQENLLEVRGLTVDYANASGRQNRAVDDVSFSIRKGETLGLVGESGSGKSTVGRTIMQLLRPLAGSITLDGTELTALPERRLRALRPSFQMIFQDPYGSLNPRRTVGDILETTLIVNGQRNASTRQAMIAKTLNSVGLAKSAAQKFPHEFSGGQRQRIGIARSIIIQPKLVVCDEPVSALDVSVQAQVLNLLVDLKREYHLSYLFISHDLAVVQYISDRVMVMKDGKIIETGDHASIWQNPATDYTRQLIAASA
jgi:peptide/nickel transport system ATP-binding protein